MTSEPNRKIKLTMNITLESIAIIAAAALFGVAAQISFLGSALAQAQGQGQEQEQEEQQQQQAFNDHVFVANHYRYTLISIMTEIHSYV
ncbi:MAG TPA: hypothetical protein VKA91_07500 [Nitrososphaeraceae archaeon]|nr:hypothetical protein [Nitrososphaeraceae archaeon]